MSHYTYLIVGGGMTGAAAVNGIREVDVNGSIGLFSIEPLNGYYRQNGVQLLTEAAVVDVETRGDCRQSAEFKNWTGPRGHSGWRRGRDSY